MSIESRVRDSFNKQKFMAYLGAELTHVAHGEVEIRCAFRPELTQQNGYIHAGVMTSLVDVACGYAALSTMPEDTDVLSVEFKTNFMRAAKTEGIIAKAKVVKTGRTLVICEGSVWDVTGKIELTRMLATMICMRSSK